MCWDGQWEDFNCPEEFPHFSLFENSCTSEFFADCKAVDRFCKNNQLQEFTVNPHSCDDYLMCTECENKFKLFDWHCPAGFKFNKQIGICDQENNFNCHVNVTGISNLPPQPFQIDCSESSSLFRRHPFSCEYYFICTSQSSNSILEKCPGNTVFDIVSERCRSAEDAVCVVPANEIIQRKKIEITKIHPKIDLL